MSTVEPIKDIKNIRKVESILKKQGLRNLLLFVIGTNSGLRISDILALNVKDIKDKDFIRIIEKKTGKQKLLPINSKIKSILNLYLIEKKDYEPLFLTINNLRMDRFGARRIIQSACRQAGLQERIGTHTLRKTFGYHHYKKFKDVAMLQKIFNHSNPSVTLRYIGIEQDEINESYLKFVL